MGRGGRFTRGLRFALVSPRLVICYGVKPSQAELHYYAPLWKRNAYEALQQNTATVGSCHHK